MAVKLTPQERKTVVDGLVSNAACCWEESDRKTLNSLNDVTLAKLWQQSELVSNAEGASKDQLDKDDDDDVAVEEEKTKKGDSQADGKEKPFGEEDPKAGDGPANNQLSARDRADLNFARKYRMQQRRGYVDSITSNAANRFTVKQLAAMSDEVLANMAQLASAADEEGPVYQQSFFGAQGAGVVNAGGEAEEPLPRFGQIDWGSLSKANAN